MTDFQQRYSELTHDVDLVLDEDLAALRRQSEGDRIEQYNRLKSDEDTFRREFAREYDQLTDSERADVRAEFRLARLLLAASFYADGDLPRAMADDFVEAELGAAVEFERYKRFDVLTTEEIESKIRRMDGEVYELVTEYTSTQIADMDALMDDPEVQSDLMRKLLDRYQQRREKIRQGFFTYVEVHGLEHMVEAIEAAVQAVSESADERELVAEELREEMAALAESVESDVRRQQRAFEAGFQRIEHTVESQTVDPEELRAEIDRLADDGDELGAAQQAALEEFAERIDRTSELESRLAEKIDQLEQVKAETREQARESAREETAAVVEEELSALREQREQLRAEIDTLERERESIQAARDRLEREREQLDEARDSLASERESLADKQAELESDVADVRRSLGGDDDLPDRAVSTSMARLLEMDYLGRFDTSIYDADTIVTPDGPFEVPDGYWENRSGHRNERGRLDQLLDADGAPERYPMNRRSRYEIADTGLLGLTRRPEMVIEVAVRSHLEGYVENGFDASPADLDDLLTVVNDAVYEAEGDDHHYLLAVASPTGWADRVREQVEGGDVARTRYSRSLSLVLVDLPTGELIFDGSDPVAADNSWLFEIPVDDERVEACVDHIQAEYVEEVGVDNVLVEEIVEAGYDVRVVRTAFERLEAAGAGDQLHVDDYGLALDFSRAG